MRKVNYRKRGAAAILELNRPEKLNAIDGEMLRAIDSALDKAAADDSVRVLQICGVGRAFSAGFDLETGTPPAGTSRDKHIREELRKDFDLIMRFWDFPKPTIASVHGYCLGSALEIAAICDITIATEDCRFGVPEVRFGSGSVCLILPWIIGLKNAREILLLGSNKISAARAESMGLVNRVVGEDELSAVSNGIADEIALNDPLAVCLTKKAINRSVEIAGLREALQQALEVDMEIETGDSADAREFNRIIQQQGSKAALAWRAARDLNGTES
jgi:enoyl-CoA hydratase